MIKLHGHNMMLKYNGEIRYLSDLIKEVGIVSKPTVYWRLKKGWSAKDALTTPPTNRKKRINNKKTIVKRKKMTVDGITAPRAFFRFQGMSI